MTAAAKIAAKINSQSETDAMAVYTAIRIEHAKARRAGADHASGLMQVMAMAGDALLRRIGEDRFDALVYAVDAQIYA